MKKILVSVLLYLSLTSLIYAADLMDVYRQALENDPAFKAAYSTYMSTSEAIPQARASLLPQMSVRSQLSLNTQNVNAGSSLIISEAYRNSQWELSASQAIFNYKAWSRVQQAKAQVKAAQATFNDAAQDLLLRTANAYLAVLLARDTLNYAEAKKRANTRQLDQATQRYKVGLDPITSVYDAQSGFDQSVAEVISAKNDEVNKNELLRKLTNHVYDDIAALRNSDIPLITPEPNNLDEWVSAGIKQNYKLFSFKYNLQAAREKIKAQSSGDWPVFGLKGQSYNARNTAGSGNFFVPNEQKTSVIAVTVDFPVFQGGLVASETKQAQFDFQTASEQLEKTYRDVVVDTHIAFNRIIDGISKVKADRQTVSSRQNSVDSTESQFLVGTRTMVDVVNAQQRLFEAQQELAKDQYSFIYAILNLKYLAGSLNVNDLEQINAWLATTRINGLAPQQRALDNS